MTVEEIRDEIKKAIENEKDEENLRLLNNARNDLDQVVARQTDTA